ncbi:dsRBD fold-containing protein [Streptomyces sp. NRRL B-24484]|uniref:dsRBD fold-containing protein n=1 Tax=Streptomyces sp. NRRL B-24484 TaxID=1463833 RepID=UPI00069507DA|nr:dsRBD fold-containing protein [Streptomyces sp. NRRL B-24484]
MSALAGEGPHTSEWQVRLMVTEDGDVTRAHAVLESGGTVTAGTGAMQADAEARRSSHDPAVPMIGDELAVGRALLDLGHRLVHAGSVAAEAAESARRRDTE